MTHKIAFMALNTEDALQAKADFIEVCGDHPLGEADIVVALGGDGFMLNALYQAEAYNLPVYGMNFGTIGFLMNSYAMDGLAERLKAAEEASLHPLRMRAKTVSGQIHNALAINEISLLRAGPQAAKLRILVDGTERMPELVCDGALLCTPAGSTAYNYSAHGPILPIGSDILALTAMASHRPRRWRGAILPINAKVRFEVLDHTKRPVMADADSRSISNVTSVEVESARDVIYRILFDPDHGLEERLIREQFS